MSEYRCLLCGYELVEVARKEPNTDDYVCLHNGCAMNGVALTGKQAENLYSITKAPLSDNVLYIVHEDSRGENKVNARQKSLLEGYQDPENYSKMVVPFESTEEANEALRCFYDDLAEIRKKHRIADIHAILKISVRHGDDVCQAMSAVHFGNSSDGEMMCAWALGEEMAERRATIQKLLGK